MKRPYLRLSLITGLIGVMAVLFISHQSILEPSSSSSGLVPAASAQSSSTSDNTQSDSRIAASYEDLYGDLTKNPDKKSLGDSTAPLTITEYVDFQCPYCRKFNLNTLPDLLRNYVKTGTVYYRIKHFPLRSHKHALKLAIVSECAAEQGEFFRFKHFHFARGGPKSIPEFLEVLDLENPNQFLNCLRDQRYRKKILNEKQNGVEKDVSATPTLFIGGEKFQGVYSFDQLKKIIEVKLKRSRQPSETNHPTTASESSNE